MKRPSLLVIFLSVFIDLIGFGIVMPLLPIYARDFHAPGYLIGLIMASFSVMQFLFAPMWGGLSDRIGRRPVILISNFGSALAYALFALASTKGGQTGLFMILASRIFAGICGANLSVASAYIADVTPAEKRSRGMALIGVAFGLGFIFRTRDRLVQRAPMGTARAWLGRGIDLRRQRAIRNFRFPGKPAARFGKRGQTRAHQPMGAHIRATHRRIADHPLFPGHLLLRRI
jgi:hypothetical protein